MTRLPLPEPKKYFGIDAEPDFTYYTAGQMQEYSGAENAALREQVRVLREDAGRYRFLAAKCRSTAEHWGGRWSIVIEGPAPTTHEEDAFDRAIDAARAKS